MSERQEQLAQLEQALLDATLQSPDCTRDQLTRALMAMDSDLPEAQACPPATPRNTSSVESSSVGNREGRMLG